MADKDNKIDSAVNEVLESQRLKQGFNGFLKLLWFIGILAIPFFILVAISGRGDDTLFGSIFAVCALVAVIYLNKKIE
jgi:hypothetical protein